MNSIKYFFIKKQDVIKRYNPSDTEQEYFKRLLTMFPEDADLTSDENKNLALGWAHELDEGNGKLLDYNANTELGAQTLANFAQSQQQVTQGVTKFRAALSSVGNVIKSVGASMLNMGIAMAASFVISKVFEVIDDHIHRSENIIKEGKEAKESIDSVFKDYESKKQSVMDLGSSFGEQADKIKTTGDAIDQVAKKYSVLRNGVNQNTNENVSLSTEEYQEYIDLSAQLASQFPELVAGYDNQGNAVLNLGTNADKAASSIRNLYEAQVASANVDMGKNLQSTYNGIIEQTSQYEQEVENKRSELTEIDSNISKNTGKILTYGSNIFEVQDMYKDKENVIDDVLKQNGLPLKENYGSDGNIWDFYVNGLSDKTEEEINTMNAEQFERAAEKVDKFRDKLDGLKALISDDMKVDKNTGLLTESGALALTIDIDDIQASTENLKTYIKERQQIINDYKADKFGEDEYNKKLKTVDDNIKNTTANINSSRSSMLDLIKTQAQAELDVLNKVIDKRKEALSAKKNYYDYDKTLKNKTKDIQILERQIAALNGSTNAEDKARRAQLQEQLSDAQDALKDTITDHVYSMQSDALDKLSTDLSEDMDEWINKISSNVEEMTNAINDAVKNAGLTTAGTINAISSILKHYGISDTEIAQSGLTDIKGYASGTDYVPKDGVYNVNENGMESVYSPKYGVLTFLNQGDKVYNADLTKSLLENARLATKNNMPDFFGMVKTMEECMYNIQNMGGNTYISNFYVDGVEDIESLYKKLDAHMDQKIQANNKKIARDIRSLR